jgi:hypothetical protein
MGSALRRLGNWVRSFLRPDIKNSIISLIGKDKYDQYLTWIGLRGHILTARPMSADEQVAIWTYTSDDGWHQRINEELWENRATREVTDFAYYLDATLRSAFKFHGPVYRGYTSDDLEDFVQGYSVGAVQEFPAFTSTTKDLNQAFVGNVLFVISAQHGGDIEELSALPAEQEVLFSTRTKFRTLAKEMTGNTAIIELEQVER